MKKLFHRKKHDDVSSSPSPSSPYADRSASGLPTSPYDSIAAGGLPQTGDYPIKGNDTANVLKKKPSRRSSFRSWRSSSGSQQPALSNRSPTPDQYASPVKLGSSPSNNMMAAESYAPQPGGQNRGSRTQLPQEFSNMSLGHDAPTWTTTTTTTTTGPRTTVHNSQSLPNPKQPHPRGPRQGPSDVNGSSIRPVNPSTMQDPYVSPRNQAQPTTNHNVTPSDVHGAYTSNRPSSTNIEPRSRPQSNDFGKQSRQRESDGSGPVHRLSIPRKEVGTASAPVPQQYAAPSQARTDHDRGMNGGQTVPSASRSSRDMTSYAAEPTSAPAAWSILDKKRSSTHDRNALDAQAVVDRARTNTKDTSIIEKYAPAVTHETVHQNIHHIREELIRKEIHTHDVYHRIQPVIDVEVLPARHFLPVEGGGLVEVNAEEVPGRGHNWVLAETVSKIPSDQPAPRGVTNFTARKFPGREGDDMKYVGPEGHEITEQSWVHPPELETGARDTGQSWPMVFGDAVPEKGTYGYKSPVHAKKRSSKYGGRISGSR